MRQRPSNGDGVFDFLAISVSFLPICPNVRDQRLVEGEFTSSPSPCRSTFAEKIAPHQFPVFGSGRGGIGLLAHAVVHAKGVLPKLLGKSVVGLHFLKGRQHNLDQGQKLRVINGWPLVLTCKKAVDLSLAEAQTNRPAAGVSACTDL